MMPLLAACVVMLAALALMALFIRGYTDFWYNIFISKKLKIIDELVSTGDVPSVWLKGFLAGERVTTAEPGSLRARLCLRRLAKMIDYVRRNTLLDQADREETLAALEKIRVEWASKWFGFNIAKE